MVSQQAERYVFATANYRAALGQLFQLRPELKSSIQGISKPPLLRAHAEQLLGALYLSRGSEARYLSFDQGEFNAANASWFARTIDPVK
jgi:hypothetical protein